MKSKVKNLPAGVAQRLATIKVLIADDDLRIAAIVRAVLDSLGFNLIYVVNNGKEALEILQKEKIDFVITDWQMSPMDGISLITYLRTSNDSPNRFLPIIMLTANAERQDVEVARDSGVTEFVIKPFSVKTLCDRIVLMINNPRSFIMTNRFIGPDRRRRHANPPGGLERRNR